MGERKVLIGAGGTAGHLIPAHELARRLGASPHAPEVLFAGGALSKNPFFDKSYPHCDLPVATFSLRRPLKAVIAIWGVIRAWKLLGSYKPDLVVGFGSFHTFPLLMAAKLRGIPFVLHEGNAYPGKVTRFFSRHAVLTGLQFEGTAAHLKGKCLPVEIARPVQTEEQVPMSSRFTCLVFGGSQGAAYLNRVVSESLCGLPAPLRVIHLTGDEEVVEPLEKLYANHNIDAYVAPYEERMDLAWQAADLTICRAGAATCSEQIAFGTRAIMVPYPHATDRHQDYNAEELEKRGGVIKVDEETLTSESLHTLLKTLLGGPLDKMRGSDNRPDFAQVVAEVAGWDPTI